MAAVTFTLEAVNNLSPVVKQAAADVTAAAQAVMAGQAGTKQSINELNAELDKAIARFTILAGVQAGSTREMAIMNATAITTAQNLNEAGDGAENFGRKVGGANVTMGQFEGLATRMIERMALLYALKGGFDFVEGFFTGATALENLHDKTGISLQDLQLLQYEANQSSVSFDTVTNAVDHLSKTLYEQKGGTASLIEKIGLDIFDLKRMDPMAAFDAIGKAIAAVQDPTLKLEAAQKLLGTEGIIPLLGQLAELEEKFKTHKTLSDDQIKTLADAEKAWKEFKDSVSESIAGVYLKAIELYTYLANPLYGKPNAPRALNAVERGAGGFLDGLAPGLGFANGEALVRALESGAFKVATQATGTSGVFQLREDVSQSVANANGSSGAHIGSGAPDGSAGGMVNITPPTSGPFSPTIGDYSARPMPSDIVDEMKAAKEAAHEANTEYEAWKKATDDLAQAGEGWKGTLDTIDGSVIEAGKYYLEAGGTVEALAKSYGLFPIQAEAIKKAFDEDRAAVKAYDTDTNTAMRNIQQWTADAATFVADTEEGKYARMRAAAEAQFQDRVYMMNQEAIKSQAYEAEYAAALLDRNAKIADANAKELASNDAKNAKEEAALQRKSDAEARAAGQNQVLWDQYYVAVEQGSGTAADIAIANIQRQTDSQLKALKDSGDYTLSNQQAIYAREQQLIDNLIKSYDPLWQAWKAGNEDMRKEWATTWDSALSGSTSFVSALAKPLDDVQTLFRKMIAGLLSDWEMQLLGPILQDTRNVLGQLFGIAPSGSSGFGGASSAAFLPSVIGAGGGIGGNYAFTGPDQGPGIDTLPSTSFIGTGISPGGGKGIQAPSRAGSIAGGAIMAAGGLYQMYQNQGAMQDLMGGAEAGAGIGTMIMPGIGTAIGAGVGAVVGGIEAILGKDNTLGNIARDAGKNFGQTWSDSLKNTVQSNTKAFHDEVAGELASLPEIMKEHPVDASNIEMYIGKAHDLFSEIQMGHMTVAQVSSELDQIFPTLAKNATDAYGRISDSLKSVIDLNKQFGTSSTAIASWYQSQGSNVLTGATSVAGALIPNGKALAGSLVTDTSSLESNQKTVNDLLAKQKTGTLTDSEKANLDYLQNYVIPDLQAQLANTRQQQNAPVNAQTAGDVGSALVGGYVTSVATGTSKSAALKAESQDLSNLEAAYKKLGVTSDDVLLNELFLQNDLQKQNPQLMAGIDGISQSMVGLDNIGLETADTFQKQEETGYAMYTRLQGAVAALGGDSKDALLPMQDYLHNAEIEAKKLGVPLDENTQAMIDQSKQLGIWKDNAGDATNPTQNLADAIKSLVDWLGKIPANKTTTVTTKYETQGSPIPTNAQGPPGKYGYNDNGTPDWNGDPTDSLAGGGVPTYASQGRAIDFKPMATDVVPAMVASGEGIVSAAAMNRIGGANGLAAINSGQGIGGGSSDKEIAALRSEQARLNDYMFGMFARDLSRSIRDEVQKVAWRKRY